LPLFSFSSLPYFETFTSSTRGKKPKGCSDVRPIAVGDTIRRLVGKATCKTLKPKLKTRFAPFQRALASGGREIVIHTIRQKEHLCDVVVSADIKNAFNEQSRASILSAIQETCPELLPLVHFLYSNPSTLHMQGAHPDHNILSCEGAQQGDPLGPILFCLGFQPLLEHIAYRFPQLIICQAYCDDLTLGGDSNTVHQALQMLHDLLPTLGLSLNPAKTKAYSPSNQNIDHLQDAGLATLAPDGMDILGCPFGSHRYIYTRLNGFLENFRQHGDKIVQFSHHGRWHAYRLLRSCLVPRFEHLCRLLPPDITNVFAVEFDYIVARTFIQSIGLPDSVLTESVRTQLSLPLRENGWALRRMSRIAPIAYLASSALCSPGIQPESNFPLPSDSIPYEEGLRRTLNCVRQFSSHPLTFLNARQITFNCGPATIRQNWQISNSDILSLCNFITNSPSPKLLVTSAHFKQNGRSNFLLMLHHYHASSYWLAQVPSAYSLTNTDGQIASTSLCAQLLLQLPKALLLSLDLHVFTPNTTIRNFFSSDDHDPYDPSTLPPSLSVNSLITDLQTHLQHLSRDLSSLSFHPVSQSPSVGFLHQQCHKNCTDCAHSLPHCRQLPQYLPPSPNPLGKTSLQKQITTDLTEADKQLLYQRSALPPDLDSNHRPQQDSGDYTTTRLNDLFSRPKRTLCSHRSNSPISDEAFSFMATHQLGLPLHLLMPSRPNSSYFCTRCSAPSHLRDLKSNPAHFLTCQASIHPKHHHLRDSFLRLFRRFYYTEFISHESSKHRQTTSSGNNQLTDILLEQFTPSGGDQLLEVHIHNQSSNTTDTFNAQHDFNSALLRAERYKLSSYSNIASPNVVSPLVFFEFGAISPNSFKFLKDFYKRFSARRDTSFQHFLNEISHCFVLAQHRAFSLVASSATFSSSSSFPCT